MLLYHSERLESVINWDEKTFSFMVSDESHRLLHCLISQPLIPFSLAWRSIARMSKYSL